MAHWCSIISNSKPKPSTLSPQPLNTHPLTQTPTPNSRTSRKNSKSSPQTLLSNSKPPPQNWKHMPFFPTFPFVPLLSVPFLLDTTRNTSIGEDFKSSFIAELWINSIKSSCNSSENLLTNRCNGSHVKLRI